jgi:hypothetical protein
MPARPTRVIVPLVKRWVWAFLIGLMVTFIVTLSPNSVPGSHTIELLTAREHYSGGNFSVFTAGAPAIYSMTPDRGAIGEAVSFTITGAGLADVRYRRVRRSASVLLF